MAYTYHELKEKNITQLRDIAKDLQHEAVQGYTQLNKEHLLVALCTALGVPMHEHHEVVGIDKAAHQGEDARAQEGPRGGHGRGRPRRSSRRCAAASTA